MLFIKHNINVFIFNFMKLVCKNLYKCSKKSFSLVEAAIYLMLVGVLTTAVIGGAELINKARIQKIYEDINGLRGSTELFKSTFGALPGNVDQATCASSDLENQKDIAGKEICTSRTIEGYAQDDLLATEQSLKSFVNANRFLNTSGIAQDASATQLSDYELDTADITTDSNFAAANGSLTYNVVAKTQKKSSYGSDNFVSMIGFSGDYASLYMLKNNSKPAEVADAKIKKFLTGKNIVAFYTNTQTSSVLGAVSPAMAKKISAKFDGNGTPKSGNMIAVKAKGSTANTVCYNNTAANIESAKFLDSKSVINGCDLIVVM